MNRTRAILLLLCCAALPACEVFSPEPTTTTRLPDGTVTVTESVEAMKERLFQERCDSVLEGTGL